MSLRDVINRGADLYNQGEPAACYRLYQGSLLTVRPLFDHKPELQKAIADGIASAQREPVVCAAPSPSARSSTRSAAR